MEKSRLALAPTRLIEAPPLTVRLLPEEPAPEPSWKTPFESLAITIEDPLPLTVAVLLLPLPAAVPLPMISRRGRSRPPSFTARLLKLPAAPTTIGEPAAAVRSTVEPAPVTVSELLLAPALAPIVHAFVPPALDW